MRARFLHTEGFRIAFLYAAVFALSVAALGLLAQAIANAAMRDQILEFAQADIAAMRDGYAQKGVHEASEVALQRMAAVGTTDFVLLQQDGRRLAGNLPAMAARPGPQEMASPTVPGHRILGSGALLAPGLYAFSGRDLAYVEAVRRRILGLLLWLFPGALLLAGLGGALVSRGFLARADAIARTCRAIMAGNLATRVPVRGSQDEMDRLAGLINAMLDRIAALMENLRQVTNDVAHDLRTPLTHLRQTLEHARHEARTPQDHEAAIDAAIAASDEILAIFAALLRIAQIEGGARRAGFARVDLAALLRRLREVYGAVAEDAGQDFMLEMSDPGTVRGDQELLFQMMANLVENAIVHTPAGTQIVCGARSNPDDVTLYVRDNGPGVPPHEHDRLFQRFYRREASRSRPGHGLGLALVAAVAELHGGTVEIATPPQGAGLEVRVTLSRTAD